MGEGYKLKTLLAIVFTALVGSGCFVYASDFSKKPISAGNLEFSNKLTGDQLIEAARKLKKADPNFKYVSVNQCGKDEYCIHFLYQNTGADNSKLSNLMKVWQKDYEKALKASSIGPAEVLCLNDCTP